MFFELDLGILAPLDGTSSLRSNREEFLRSILERLASLDGKGFGKGYFPIMEGPGSIRCGV